MAEWTAREAVARALLKYDGHNFSGVRLTESYSPRALEALGRADAAIEAYERTKKSTE